ncbi:hypothetical protein JCM8547_003618 [Rhodosporidiobolus lusitaniae]
MDEIKKIPPFTRTVVGGVVLATVPTLLMILSPYHLAFLPQRIAVKWEVWRLVTPFLYGGRGLPLVFNLIMLYRSLVDLEESHFGRRLGEMTWAFILQCGAIIGLNTPLGTPFLFNPLMLAVIHLWGQTNPTNRVSLYGIVNIPAPYFPFAMLAMDLLNGGPPAVLVSFTGMVAAHAYYFLSVILPRQNGGRQNPLVQSLLTPPAFLTRLLDAPSAPGERGPTSSFGFGTAFRSGGQRLGSAPGSVGGRGGAGYGASATTAAAGGSTTGSTGVRQTEQQAAPRWPGQGNRLGTE